MRLLSCGGRPLVCVCWTERHRVCPGAAEADDDQDANHRGRLYPRSRLQGATLSPRKYCTAFLAISFVFRAQFVFVFADVM